MLTLLMRTRSCLSAGIGYCRWMPGQWELPARPPRLPQFRAALVSGDVRLGLQAISGAVGGMGGAAREPASGLVRDCRVLTGIASAACFGGVGDRLAQLGRRRGWCCRARVRGTVLAWFAAHLVARVPLSADWRVQAAQVEEIGGQTGQEMDDVGAITERRGYVFVQAKLRLQLGAACRLASRRRPLTRPSASSSTVRRRIPDGISAAS